MGVARSEIIEYLEYPKGLNRGEWVTLPCGWRGWGDPNSDDWTLTAWHSVYLLCGYGIKVFKKWSYIPCCSVEMFFTTLLHTARLYKTYLLEICLGLGIRSWTKTRSERMDPEYDNPSQDAGINLTVLSRSTLCMAIFRRSKLLPKHIFNFKEKMFSVLFPV